MSFISKFVYPNTVADKVFKENTELRKKVDLLQLEAAVHLHNMGEMRDYNKDLEVKVTNLKGSNVELRGQVVTLQNQRDHLRKENVRLREAEKRHSNAVGNAKYFVCGKVMREFHGRIMPTFHPATYIDIEGIQKTNTDLTNEVQKLQNTNRDLRAIIKAQQSAPTPPPAPVQSNAKLYNGSTLQFLEAVEEYAWVRAGSVPSGVKPAKKLWILRHEDGRSEVTNNLPAEPGTVVSARLFKGL